MRLNSKGQVTIPAQLRHKHGLVEGDEVDVVDVDGVLQIVPTVAPTRGARLVTRLRGRAPAAGRVTTDELMALLRDDA